MSVGQVAAHEYVSFPYSTQYQDPLEGLTWDEREKINAYAKKKVPSNLKEEFKVLPDLVKSLVLYIRGHHNKSSEKAEQIAIRELCIHLKGQSADQLMKTLKLAEEKVKELTCTLCASEKLIKSEIGLYIVPNVLAPDDLQYGSCLI